jgi:O-antigen ligase
VIRDNWLLGVGTGDVKSILEESYRKNGMEGAFSHKLNTHNQYLQTFAAIGIFGFLTLLGMIMIPLFFGGNRTDAIMVVFVTLFAFNILVESMFETHAGIFFFGFFYTIIPFLGKKEEAA